MHHIIFICMALYNAVSLLLIAVPPLISVIHVQHMYVYALLASFFLPSHLSLKHVHV